MTTWRFSFASILLTFSIAYLPAPVLAQPRQTAAEMEAPIVAWTNAVRIQHGKAPLRVNDDLTRAAALHARNMARQEIMTHTLDNLTMVDRVRKVGYPFASVGENVAFAGGYHYPAWVMFDGWMRSEGHYRNIMSDQFTEIGVGVARSETGKFYACQVFGRPDSAPRLIPYSSAPAPQLPYSSNPGTAAYPRPTSNPQPPPTPYSVYPGAPGWQRSYPYRQPVDDMHWYGPWDWR